MENDALQEINGGRDQCLQEICGVKEIGVLYEIDKVKDICLKIELIVQ